MRPIKEIAALTSEAFGVSVEDLRGPCKAAWASVPRQVAMWFANQEGHSLSAIGRYFGGRDHTTIRHAVNRFYDHVVNYGEEINFVHYSMTPAMFVRAVTFKSTRAA